MRALADPVRLRLLDALRRSGPAGADALAVEADAAPSSVEAHLLELERFGLVEHDGSTWQAVGKGVFFEIADDPDGGAAARQLANVLYLSYADLPARWVADAEPRLELDWARAAGMLNARVSVTPDELRAIQVELEGLLGPYLAREPDGAPEHARSVRILSYFLPEPPVGRADTSR